MQSHQAGSPQNLDLEFPDKHRSDDFLHLQNFLPSSMHNDIHMNITVKICDQISEEKRKTLC